MIGPWNIIYMTGRKFMAVGASYAMSGLVISVTEVIPSVF
jgi:hypothetical protein